MADKFKDYNFSRDGVVIHINMGRPNARLQKAQVWLEQQVMNDMLPFMPMVTGNFQQRTRAANTAMLGHRKVMAAAPPFGRFLYEAKLMVDPETGSSWARKDAKKVVTDRDLTFSRPGATARWFEAAKAAKLGTWTSGVKKIMRGG